LASTYTVTYPWQSKSSGYYDSSGTKWTSRRQVLTYEYGKATPIATRYEYKNIKTTSTPTPIPSPSPPTGDQSTDVIDPGSDYVAPSGDPFLEMGLTSAERALYDSYTQYLDTVDYWNNDLRAKLEMHYLIEQQQLGYSDEEREYKIDKEFQKLNRVHLKYSFEDWKEMAKWGSLPDMQTLYGAPSLADELDAHKEMSNKFATGMKYGFELVDRTGLIRIAAMGLAGMPPGLVGSMAMSTAGYGLMERMAGRQDIITRTVGDVRDKLQAVDRGLKHSGSYDETHWKNMYERMNEQALNRGIITSPWRLRLSKNVPIKERWRRLAVTLADHIDKEMKKQ
jgi:hypothetical protein